MTLEIRKTSKWWYGRWMKDGKRHCAKLEVEIDGTPGEQKFDVSREKAQAALDKVIVNFREQKRPEDLVQEIHRVKFGRRVGSVAIADLYNTWLEIPRKRQPKEAYLKWSESIFIRFQDFLKDEFPKVKEMAAVDRKVAEGFMRHEQERGISPKTYNAELILMRGAFEHLREDAGMLTNPFTKVVTKDSETIHRKPFSQEELTAILEAAKNDALMYPLIVIGVFTAMRRGDACLLKWEDVDLKNGFVRVKTSKTGETVEIPMFQILRELLMVLDKNKGKGPYVIPDLAAMYNENPDGVNWRLRQVFTKAGFIDHKVIEDKNKKREAKGLPPLEIKSIGDQHLEREEGKGLQDASLRGFHSFRVTWITMALAAGVPIELVQRVTGHQTTQIVMKHYFRPGREQFAKAIEGAMPKMLTQGVGVEGQVAKGKDGMSVKEQVLAICSAMTRKTWKMDAERIADIVTHMPDTPTGSAR